MAKRRAHAAAAAACRAQPSCVNWRGISEAAKKEGGEEGGNASRQAAC